MNEFESLQLGDSAMESRKITSDVIEEFARVSGDYNPIHMDDEFASKSFFQGKIAHGMLVASLISSVLGNKLPGYGTIYSSQTLKFIAPVRPGDEITATVIVTKLNRDRGQITLATEVKNQDNKTVLKGDAEVIMSSYLKMESK
jgi:3-hydroxybutyryl-CoA dehydratase